MIFILYPRASVAAKRINEVLETKPSIKEGTIEVGTEKGTIEFKNVSFKYPDAENYVIKDINFKAKKGETIAFIGRTGSGKSTVINLIPRLYDATDGEVLVDGINVKEYKEKDLNDRIGYISQKAVMFKGTVKDNVGFGKKENKRIKEENIKEAIKVAQAEEFVKTLPKTYDYQVAESGTNLSGGQKQRLSIARAIAKNPEIYIFDDSFSALDYKTDFKLRKELKKHTKDSTVVIVASRIGTIKDANQIFVIEDGEVVGSGTHKQLLKTCSLYKEIALSQLGKEEVENA
jgi:ATP-binding cassette subfamily B protein